MVDDRGTMELLHVPGGPDDPLLTAAEYARRKGVSRQAVSAMRKTHGVKLDGWKRAPLSAWEAASALGASMDRNTMGAVGGEKGVAALHAKQRVKKTALEIEALEISNAKARGDLIERSECDKKVAAVVTVCLELMEHVALNWAATTRDVAGYDLLVKGMDDARREFAERFA